MSRRQKSPFLAWAEKQFGPRPSKKSHAELAKAAGQAQHAWHVAKRELELVTAWEDKVNAAAYAWNITDEQKKPGGIK